MMKKSLFICLIVFIFILVGCKKKDPIVGEWAYGSSNNFVYTFNEDGTCHYTANNKKCTYTIESDKISILYDGDTVAFETTFKIEDNKLIIKDYSNNDVVYNKR